MNDTLIHRQVQVVLSPEARQWILEKTCADRNYGARPLRRALQKYVEDPLSEALIQEGFKGRRRCKCMSQGMACRSDLLLRQPRLSTKESDTTRAVPALPEACTKAGPHRARQEKNNLRSGARP